MSCAFPWLDADEWLTLADRIAVFHQPFDDLRWPRCRDRALPGARDDSAEIRGMADGSTRDRRARILQYRTERSRRRRDDQPPLRCVAVTVARDRLAEMLLDQFAGGIGRIPGLDRPLRHPQH